MAARTRSLQKCPLPLRSWLYAPENLEKYKNRYQEEEKILID